MNPELTAKMITALNSINNPDTSALLRAIEDRLLTHTKEISTKLVNQGEIGKFKILLPVLEQMEKKEVSAVKADPEPPTLVTEPIPRLARVHGEYAMLHVLRQNPGMSIDKICQICKLHLEELNLIGEFEEFPHITNKKDGTQELDLPNWRFLLNSVFNSLLRKGCLQYMESMKGAYKPVEITDRGEVYYRKLIKQLNLQSVVNTNGSVQQLTIVDTSAN